MSVPSAGTADARDWQSILSVPDILHIRALLAEARAFDDVAPWGGHVIDGLGGIPDGRMYVLVRHAGQLVGAVAWIPGDPAEVVVRPADRGRGLGTELVGLALDRAGSVWAHGNLPAAHAVAASTALRRTRELLQMGRPLGRPGELGPVGLPPAVRLRPFRPDVDDEEFLAVNARAFSWHPEQGRLDQDALDLEKAQSWFDPAGFLLAVTAEAALTGGRRERLLGFHWTRIHPAAGVVMPAPVGEIYVLAVDPLSQVRRLGRPLTIAGLDHLASRGLAAAMLYVEADNAVAVRLYRDIGFTVTARDVVYARSALRR